MMAFYFIRNKLKDRYFQWRHKLKCFVERFNILESETVFYLLLAPEHLNSWENEPVLNLGKKWVSYENQLFRPEQVSQFPQYGDLAKKNSLFPDHLPVAASVFKRKPWKIKVKGFHTFLNWHDNTDYLKYLFIFKQIVPLRWTYPR